MELTQQAIDKYKVKIKEKRAELEHLEGVLSIYENLILPPSPNATEKTLYQRKYNLEAIKDVINSGGKNFRFLMFQGYEGK